MASRIYEDEDIASFRTRLERDLVRGKPHMIPTRNRQGSLDTVKSFLSSGAETKWTRFALDLTTHTLFRTERVLEAKRFRNAQTTAVKRITDFEHWNQMVVFLSERYGDLVEELKLLLIAGSFVEIEAIISGEIDALIGPYRATQDIEARIRHQIAEKPRSFDIESLKKLEAQYNRISGTPIHELVEAGLSNVINLYSQDDICHGHQRIFVDRHSERSCAEQGIALFALSYKHEGSELRMSKESFLEVCNALRSLGFARVQLWIDALLKETEDTWARRGLLPYTVLPIVIHNNELYDRSKERIWLKLERVASSGRSGVLYTRLSAGDRTSWRNYVTGDSRDLVAGCVLAEDFDPNSVTFQRDIEDLKEWAIEHLSVATFRSFLGISKIGSGDVPPEAKKESIRSGIVTYNETTADGTLQCFAKLYSSFPHLRSGGRCEEQESRARVRNERLMTFMCRIRGFTYHVRLNHGLRTSVLQVNPKGCGGKNCVSCVHKVSTTARQYVLRTLADRLIQPAQNRQGDCHGSAITRHLGLWSGMKEVVATVRDGTPSCRDGDSSEYERSRIVTKRESDAITLDKWKYWPEVFGRVEQ